MKKILLINTAYDMREKFSSFSPPMGLLSISSCLQNSGYEVVLIDPRLDPNYLASIEKEISPDLLYVGMTVFMGSNALNAVTLSTFIKNIDPTSVIVWGGPLPTSSPEMCFAGSPVDYIAMGMGEVTSVLLADCLKKGEDATGIPNISSCLNGQMIIKDPFFFQGDLDEFPFPDLLLWDEGVKRMGSIPIISSRGCPKNCAYCFNNQFTGRKKWFFRSAENILTEMRQLRDKFDESRFFFIDDNFLVNQKRACQVLKSCREEGFKITKIIGSLMDFRENVLELMDGYVKNVSFSVESASQKIQTLINKKVPLDRALEVFQLFTDRNIDTINTNFMFGFPTESGEDILANIDMAVEIHKINKNIRMVPYVYAPQPRDDIIGAFPEHLKKITFTFENMASIDFAPNRTRFLDHSIRPWMTETDINFYIDLVIVWFHYFDPVVSRSQAADVGEIFSRNKRLESLFKHVPIPCHGLDS